MFSAPNVFSNKNCLGSTSKPAFLSIAKYLSGSDSIMICLRPFRPPTRPLASKPSPAPSNRFLARCSSLSKASASSPTGVPSHCVNGPFICPIGRPATVVSSSSILINVAKLPSSGSNAASAMPALHISSKTFFALLDNLLTLLNFPKAP